LEFQIVTRWVTTAPSGNQFVGGINDPNPDWVEIGVTGGNGINVQIQRLNV
jgi:hypothetical protein